MDTTGWILLALLAVAIVGQLCLPLIGRWSRRRDAVRLAKARACLLEAAAESQAHKVHISTAKLPDTKLPGDSQ